MSSFFGYDHIGGGGNDNPSGNVVWCLCVAGDAAPATPAVNGTLKGIWVYCQNSVGSGGVHAALYSDSSGLPGSLLAGSSVPTNCPPGGSPAWVFVDLSAAALSVTAGTQYWIAVRNKDDGGATDFAVNFDAATDIYYAGNPISPLLFPATASGLSHAVERWSVYAEFTPGAALPADQILAAIQPPPQCGKPLPRALPPAEFSTPDYWPIQTPVTALSYDYTQFPKEKLAQGAQRIQ